MRKILRIINRFNLGGPTYNASYLTKYLDDEYETLLVGGQKQDEEGSSLFIPESLGLEPVVIDEMRRSINPILDYRAYKKLRGLIKTFKPDIVHTHASKSGALGRLAAIHEKVPVIVHTFHGHVFHSYFGNVKTEIYKRIERWLAKHSNAVIAISPKQKSELVEDFQICEASKAHVVPLGFDLERFDIDKSVKREEFRKKYGISEGEIAIGIVGRLTEIKNHRLFIEIIEQLNQQSHFKFKALIIGDGELKTTLLDFCHQKKLISTDFTGNHENYDIGFTSWIPQIDEAYPGLDLVLLTSFNEGTPVSIIEAQASGKVVLSTDVGGVGDIIEGGKTGFVVRNFSSEGFVDLILKVTKNKDLMARVSLDAKTSSFHNHNVARLTKDVKSLYEQLLSVIK